MNSGFFTEEFRTFKYLSSPHADYYKKVNDLFSKIDPYVTVDSTFTWQKRIEFPEQLIDMRGNDIWIVSTETDGSPRSYTNQFNDMNIVHITKAIPHYGFSLKPGRFITQDDIPELTDGDWGPSNTRAYVSSSSYYYNVGIEKELVTDTDPMICIDMWSLPIFSGEVVYDAVFYDKEWAMLYHESVRLHKRKIRDTVSTITSYLLG